MARKTGKHPFETTPPTDPKITQPGAPYPTNARRMSLVTADKFEIPKRQYGRGEFIHPEPARMKEGTKTRRFNDE
jgi:hypothetical protein